MNAKSLRNILTIIAFNIFVLSTQVYAADTAWANDPTGKCYQSINKYMVETFGSNYDNDENLKIINATKRGDYKWVFDATPEINITRILFKVKKNSACVILYAPLSSTIKPNREIDKFDKKPQYFISINTPAPSFPTTKILYAKNRQGFFSPKNCYQIGKVDKKINCSDAFKD